MDDTKRVSIINSCTVNSGVVGSKYLSLDEVRIRYQYGNHLGSASLELDVTGNLVSYQEYFPFGGTSYTIGEVGSEYRFTGKERDDFSGLYYFGSRYFASWIGRWMSADPKRENKDGLNLYAYVRNNPVTLSDPNGKESKDQSWTPDTHQEGQNNISMSDIPAGKEGYYAPSMNENSEITAERLAPHEFDPVSIEGDPSDVVVTDLATTTENDVTSYEFDAVNIFADASIDTSISDVAQTDNTSVIVGGDSNNIVEEKTKEFALGFTTNMSSESAKATLEKTNKLLDAANAEKRIKAPKVGRAKFGMKKSLKTARKSKVSIAKLAKKQSTKLRGLNNASKVATKSAKVFRGLGTAAGAVGVDVGIYSDMADGETWYQAGASQGAGFGAGYGATTLVIGALAGTGVGLPAAVVLGVVAGMVASGLVDKGVDWLFSRGGKK